MEFLKKYWKLLLSVVGGIVSLLFLRKYFRSDLETELKTIATEVESKNLDNKQAELKQQETSLEETRAKELDKLKDTKEELSKASTKEVEDYYKK